VSEGVGARELVSDRVGERREPIALTDRRSRRRKDEDVGKRGRRREGGLEREGDQLCGLVGDRRSEQPAART
jgi:hypothetical protein